MCCHLLIKSANLSHSPTYEFLTSYTFGSFGKFIIEISMIGFMMGKALKKKQLNVLLRIRFFQALVLHFMSQLEI